MSFKAQDNSAYNALIFKHSGKRYFALMLVVFLLFFFFFFFFLFLFFLFCFFVCCFFFVFFFFVNTLGGVEIVL